jgi:membrane protein DedA with SNARE-associated domain
MIDLLISRFGLPALGLAAGVEGEASAILGGVLAHRALFPISHAIAAVAIGSFFVDQILFSLGRLSQRSAWVRSKLASPSSHKIFWMINYHPNALIMACRFAYGFRTIVPIAIGASAISRLRFTTFNGLAAIIWATTFVEIGDHAGGLAETLLGDLHVGALPILSVGAVIAAIAAISVYLAQRRTPRAEA